MTGVSDEMVRKAFRAYDADTSGCPDKAMRAVLAAVMPDVVAAERESCAVIAEGHNKLGMYSTIIADAIRARGDAIAEPPADG